MAEIERVTADHEHDHTWRNLAPELRTVGGRRT